VAVAGLVLASCGGGDSDHVSSQPETTTTTVTLPATAASTATTTSTAPAPTTSSTIAPGTVVVNPPATTTTGPPPTTAAPPASTTTTTTPNAPARKQAAILQKKLLAKVGTSNRGVPDDVRFEVEYTPGQSVRVTWSINNGVSPLPTGEPACDAPPPTTVVTTSTVKPGQHSASTARPKPDTPTTTVDPAKLTTKELARLEAKEIVVVTKSRLGHLDLDDLVLVGNYPLSSPADAKVVEVTYSKATVQAPKFNYKTAFQVPPAESLTCIDPAFD
jgi:hypothetical protein